MPANNWTNALADGDGDAAGNWSQGHFPLSSEDVTITGSDTITFTTNTEIPCNNFVCTLFSGTLVHAGDFTIQLHGTICRLSAGMTAPDFFVLNSNVGASVTLGLDGFTTTGIMVLGSSGGSWSFAGNGQLKGFSLQSGTASLSWGASQMTSTLEAGQERGFDGYTAGATLTFSPGAKWTITGGVGSYFDMNCGATPLLLPPIEIDGDVQMYSQDNAKCQSYLQGASSAGAYLGDMGTFETIGDFTILGGPLTSDGTTQVQTGNIFLIGGDCHIVPDIDLNGGTWTVTGDADYDGTGTISNTDFSGGSTLYAPNATEGTGNNNVVFGSRPSGSNSGSATIGAGAGF